MNNKEKYHLPNNGLTIARAILIGLAIIPLGASCSRKAKVQAHPASITPFDHNYLSWARVLARCATPDGFRYALLARDRTDLDQQLAQFSSVSPEHYELFSRDQQLAFLINAHNAFAIRRILDHYPVSSIEKAGSGRANALKEQDIKLLGRSWSLLSLRGEVMGSRFSDARVIFVLSWGMKGCMPLLPAPVRADGLSDLLERQAHAFVHDKRYCRYNTTEQIISCSSLVQDYQKDFDRDFTVIWSFFRHYGLLSEGEPAKKTKKGKEQKQQPSVLPRIRFFTYDKSLDDAPVAGE